jgi:hypothetical protein
LLRALALSHQMYRMQEALLENRLVNVAECPVHLQEMGTGSLVGLCEATRSPLALWKGKAVVKLFVSADDAASLLARIRTL